ncbi:glycosyl transferase [Echinicola pacifica]|uniref:Glycosyl transferase n=1 Tax=Echinicola pacifica TaxID=346377 RepID=A0A918UQJ8_9BACT|nr:glycosyltransferase family protein [Echinicola pacifica]GGZ26524.1 glycosyl transferase [Echinicola pacifica]
MRIVFIVQGEGRGHMTQALALSHWLESEGHQVLAVLIGKSKRRNIPDFFSEGINCPLIPFESPNFVTDKGGKTINLKKTIGHNLARSATFGRSLRLIHQTITECSPDLIINFYDLLAGIYACLYRPKAEYWAIGHQYLIYHPDFPFARKSKIQKALFQLNTKITCLGASRLLALSFRPLPNDKDSRLVILPPLLRRQVKEYSISKQGFILTYMVNAGYSEELIDFCRQHPSIELQAFWDNREMPNPYTPIPNLTFHHLSDSLYLEKMASCRGLLTSAGFESVCEAMYYGKPVMMVPVQGQYEQECNALDALLAGAGISHNCFDIKKFDKYLSSNYSTNGNFVNWEMQLGPKLREILGNSPSKGENTAITSPKYLAEV